MFKNLFNYILANISYKNIFKVTNLIKLLLLYFICIIWVALLYFDFSPLFFSKIINHNFHERKIAVYGVLDRIGESLLYERVLRSLNKMNIDYAAIRYPESLCSFWFTRHFFEVTSNIINYFFKPDFNLSLTHHVNILPLGINVTYLNMPTSSLFEPSGSFKPLYQHLKLYDAYADLYTFSNGHNPVLIDAIKYYGLKDKKIIPIYLAQDHADYKVPNFEKALITGSLWGCSRGSLRFTRALKKLALSDLLVAYGLADYLKFLGASYKGNIINLGNVMTSLEELQNKYGIALIPHSLEHMLEGLPTNRISEASSSAMVIISDKNPFLTKYFGENILYYNAFGSDQEIYEEIKNHILWVLNNQKEALKKSKKVYEIFTSQFTLERQLEELFKEMAK